LHTTARGKVKGRVKGKVKTNAKGEKHRKDDGKGMANVEKGKIAQATLGRSGDEHSAVCKVPPSRRMANAEKGKIAQATLGRSGGEHSAVCEVPPSRRLYIGNISRDTSVAELYDIFDGTKKPYHLTIQSFGEYTVFAFASFKTGEAACNNLEQIRGMILNERKLAVYFAWDGALMKDEAEEP